LNPVPRGTARIGPPRSGTTSPLTESLPPDDVGRLKRDVDAYHRHYTVPAGLHMRREYLVALGRRR
jgi:hypothetical protein